MKLTMRLVLLIVFAALNVTAAQLGDPTVLLAIRARGAAAPTISFEIVESVLLDDMTPRAA